MTLKPKLEKKLRKQLPDLIKRIKDGEPSAKEEFAILLLPYFKLLLSKYKRVIDDDIESLSGLVITRLIQKIDTIDLDKPIVGFMARAAINGAIDDYRKINKKKKINQLVYDGCHEYFVKSSDNFTEYTEDQIKDFLRNTFTESDTEIVTLYYVNSKSFLEISELTGQEVREVQEVIHYAKEAFVR